MTPEKQRRAIAERLGWTHINSTFFGYWPGAEDPSEYDVVPAYCTDLNAIHEAEKTLHHRDRRNHALWLADKCGDLGCIYATAAQRAEAFLRAVGKWEDGE